MQDDFSTLFGDEVLFSDKVKKKIVQLKEGERRMVSILFADIKGFTALSEKLDHEEVHNLLDKILKIFSQSVENFGGYVDKYTGDQIMALFGAKVASEVDTKRAITCGLDLLHKIDSINKHLSGLSKYEDINISLAIRVGINSGMVTTGRVGKKREGDFTVYGDAVNLASRMESNAPINTVMISENTMKLVEHDFTFIDHGEITVKGKSQPISVFIVDGISKTLSVDSQLSPFVGRKIELETISTQFSKSIKALKKSNQQFGTSICGVAGIGKSRLIYEMFRTLEKTYQCKFSYISGSASNLSSQPYFLFISLLKNIIRINQTDSKDQVFEKIEKEYKNISKFLVKDEHKLLIDTKPIISFILGIKSDDVRLSSTGEELQTYILISIRHFLESKCKQSNSKGYPLIIYLEDLHWLDPLSLKAIDYILFTFNNENNGNDCKQAFWIFDYRPEFNLPKTILENIHLKNIELERLNEDDCLQFINKISSDIELSKHDGEELLLKSEGNPFYLEEWVQFIKENDEDHHLIPVNLNALILSRIDSLSKDLKLLLQKASIVGGKFLMHIISELEKKLDIQTDVSTYVHNLEVKDFIHEHISENNTYLFKHIITRDVAYDTILQSNRKILHGLVGKIIEELFPDMLDIFANDLAEHYSLAEVDDKVVKYCEIAGNNARKLFDNEKVIDYYLRVINILINSKYNGKMIGDTIENIKKEEKVKLENDVKSTIIHLLRINYKLIKTYKLIGKWKEAEEICLDIINISKFLNDEKNNGKYTQLLGQIYHLQSKNNQAMDMYNIQQSICEKNNDVDGKVNVLGDIGLVYIETGKLEEANKCFTEQKKYYELQSMEKELGMVHGNLGIINLYKGNLDDAFANFKKKYEVASSYKAKYMEMQAMGNMGIVFSIKGEFDKALKIQQKILGVSKEIGDRKAISQSYGNLGITLKEMGDFELAIKNYNRQLDISEKLEDKASIATVKNNIGIVFSEMGQFNNAVECLNESITINKSIDNKNGLADAYGNLAKIHIKQGKFNVAMDILKMVKKILSSIDDKWKLAIVDSDVACIYKGLENYTQSLIYYTRSIEVLVKLGDQNNLAEMLSEKSQILYLLKQYDNGLALAEKSIDIAKKVDSKEWITNSKIMLLINSYHISDDNDKPSIISSLDNLLNSKLNENHIALINYYIWELSGNEKHRKISINNYSKLQEKSPQFDYRQKLDRMQN